MKKVKIKCVSKTPLLMDPMTEDTLESLRTGVRKDVARDRPAVDVAAEKIYRENGNKGKIGLPSEMLFSCLAAAGRNIKNGKKQISTQTTTTIPDFLSIESIFLPLTNVAGGKEEDSWKVDKRRGVLKQGGKSIAVCIVRPRFEKWGFEVEITYDESKIDGTTVKSLFENAGSAQGLGSFRPNCKGPFGRFQVDSWKETKVA